MMRTRVAASEARIWTWEAVTDFDSSPSHENLLKWLREDFPNTLGEKVPVYREMIGFNSSGGRRHRFLVALADSDLHGLRRRFDRVLPRMAMLYGAADALMRTNEGFGNLRYAVLADGVLYILVFFEGRLCHWTEEVAHDTESAADRLERFDEFLKRDDLFSRAESWQMAFTDFAEFTESQKESFFRSASRDPFWRDFDLDVFEGIKPRAKFRLGVLTVASVALIVALAWHGFESEDKVMMHSKEPPALSPAPRAEGAEGVEEAVEPSPSVVKKSPGAPDGVFAPVASVAAAPDCGQTFHVRGIVGGRIFQAETGDGRRVWLRTGDSLGNFRVESIGSSNVSLACGGRTVEVENGP